MDPVLVAVRSLGGSATIKEITSQVIGDLNLPSHITEIPHERGDRTMLEYNLAWARSNLKKLGLIVNSEKGVWSLTSKGNNAESADSQVGGKCDKSLVISKEQGIGEEVPTDREDGLAAGASEETAVWRENLLGILLELPFDAFERLCQRMLRESGFIEVQVTGKTGDGGIDGHGIIRFGGLISFRVLFQCKRYKNSNAVSTNVVRDFRGAMAGRADRGLILTTSRFTNDAQKEATRDGVPPIDLIDGEMLIDKLKELELGVNIETVEEVEVDTKWFDSI